MPETVHSLFAPGCRVALLLCLTLTGCPDPETPSGQAVAQCDDLSCPLGSVPVCDSDLASQCDGDIDADVIMQRGSVSFVCNAEGGVSFACRSTVNCDGSVRLTRTRGADGSESESFECVAAPDPCRAVDCGGNGNCIAEGANARCDCDPGFEAAGTTCVAEVERDAGAGGMADMGGMGMGGSGGMGGMGGAGGAIEHGCRDHVDPETGISWICIEGDEFVLGNPVGEQDERTADQAPQRRIVLQSFHVSATEITVEQYRTCVTAGGCGTAGLTDTLGIGRDDSDVLTENDPACTWPDDRNLPLNCVSWDQASGYAAWAGGSLPSEAQWEFVARSRGVFQTYPWGEAPAADCDHAVIEVVEQGGHGCGTGLPAQPCTREAGNSAQGVCDLIGNMSEWTADWYGSYELVREDGTPRPGPGEDRVVRGGSWRSGGALSLTSTWRTPFRPHRNTASLGFRVVKPAD